MERSPGAEGTEKERNERKYERELRVTAENGGLCVFNPPLPKGPELCLSTKSKLRLRGDVRRFVRIRKEAATGESALLSRLPCVGESILLETETTVLFTRSSTKMKQSYKILTLTLHLYDSTEPLRPLSFSVSGPISMIVYV